MNDTGLSFLRYGAADAQAVARLFPTKEDLYLVYPNGYFPLDQAQMNLLERTREHLTVVYFDGELIGFANLYNVKKGKSAFIGNVVIDKRFRGRGFGRELVEHMVDICRNTLNVTARLSVFAENQSAMMLYASLGFTPYGIEVREGLDNSRKVLLHFEQA